MKRHLFAGAALLALSALPACDAVRLPGINPSGQETAAAAPPQEPRTSDSGVMIAEAATLDDAVGETPTVDRGAPPDAEAEAGEEDTLLSPESISGEKTGSEETEEEAPGLTLAELNAVACGLPDEAPPTPTVGMVAGATQTEDAAVGAEAVN
ncbi:MAG: hypothetical protein CME96_09675, partial [Hyphomonas sp.]|nr:hypothetical protein [Hyphomonas sp.]